MFKSEADKQLEETKFAKAKLNGASNTKAAMIATGTDSKDVAKTQGHRLSTSVNVQQAIIDTLESQGIDFDQVLKPIAEGLKATKVIVMGKNTDDSFVDVIPDHSARLKASDMALKLMGAYTPVKQPPAKPDKLSPDDLTQLKERIDKGDVAALERIVFKSEGNGA